MNGEIDPDWYRKLYTNESNDKAVGVMWIKHKLVVQKWRFLSDAVSAEEKELRSEMLRTPVNMKAGEH